MSNYLELLNPQQRAAVENLNGPMMIVAGAGSGKTRVITYRIAHMIHNGVDPFSILALTFTNKAAAEMRQRITSIVGGNARNIWMGTFHSVFARILRMEADKIGYPANFTIYDKDDAKSLIKSILKEQNLDEKNYNPNHVLHRISSAKNNLISAKEYNENDQIQAEDYSLGKSKIGYIYSLYSNRCERAGAMDFDDLLFKTNILLRDYPEVLHKYQHKFKYIMVDEYQDTNYSQYLIVKKLAAINENICVVGDDAQSIYAFRGANIQNILNFEKDYPDLKVYKLEENYRSTQNIVQVANSIIKNNQDQIQKNVFSQKETGEKISLLKAFTDNEEGKLVAESIAQARDNENLRNKDFAILYRTNSQSRAMEEALRKMNIPYKIYGGLSFYQRKEIKDLIAYFRLAVNHVDEEAFKRVINYPIRGIGKTSLDKLILVADEQKTSLWEVSNHAAQHIGGKSGNSIEQFAMMIKSFAVVIKNQSAFDAASHIAKQCGLLKELYDDKSVEGLNRYENIQELLNGIKDFSERDDIDNPSLDVFLQDVALLTGDEKEEDKDKDHVSLMTIHSAKGLEFPHVYVVGLEENLFPSQMSLHSRADLEEERRLFYVAITRAERKLTLSYAISRYKWGSPISCDPSRFLEEIDAKYLEVNYLQKPIQGNTFFDKDPDQYNSVSIKPKTTVQANPNKVFNHVASADFVPSSPTDIRVGMEVEHKKFGFGKVLEMEGSTGDIKTTIHFNGLGKKQLLLKFAKLRIVN
ncbi:MAG: ATP-dependent helicase [bacterium]|jgi:DNA helicase-2/ATP-dependent DNA helicase PcrA